MKRLALGVMGHVDHGKTALVRALTGTDTDRLPEEKRRGISIALGFAHAAIEGVEVDFIDLPGHERFIRTMVSGATGVDAVLLAVAANEGISPQTVEHIDIAGLLGLERAVIAVTKTDLVSSGEAERVGVEALALLRGAGLQAGAPVQVSASTGFGMDRLRAAIAALPTGMGGRDDDGFFYLPIDRAFTLAGHGTVVTGTLRRGTLTDSSAVANLLPAGVPVRFRRLQVHGRTVTSAEPGQRVAANLRGVDAGQVPRGAAIITGGLLKPTSWISVELTSVPSAPKLSTTQRLQLLFGTDEMDVRLRLLDRDELAPGETAFAQLKLSTPVALPTREAFILRIASPAATVAGGRVLDTVSLRLRRRASGGLARLKGLSRRDPSAIIGIELERAGARGVPIPDLARLAGLGLTRARNIIEALPAVTDQQDVVTSAADFERLLDTIPTLIGDREALHQTGLSREQLNALLPHARGSVIEEAARRLAARGTLKHENGRYRISRPKEDEQRALRETVAATRLAEELRTAGLTPPNVLQDPKARPLVDRLVRQGTLIRTLDRIQEREIVFHREAVEGAKARLLPLLTGSQGLLTGEIGAALNISRKYSVPLLEYLDMIRFTKRIADRRVLNQPS